MVLAWAVGAFAWRLVASGQYTSDGVAEMFGQLDLTKNGLVNKLELRQASSAGLLSDLGLPDHTQFLAAADQDENSMLSELELQDFLNTHELRATPTASTAPSPEPKSRHTAAPSSVTEQSSELVSTLSSPGSRDSLSTAPFTGEELLIKDFIEKGFVELRLPASEMPRTVHRQIYERIFQLWQTSGRKLGAGLGNNLLPAVPELQVGPRNPRNLLKFSHCCTTTYRLCWRHQPFSKV